MTSPELEITKETKLIKDVPMFVDYLNQMLDLKARLTVQLERTCSPALAVGVPRCGGACGQCWAG